MPTDHLVRCRRAKPILDEIAHKVKMAELLLANSFDHEGSEALADVARKIIGVFYLFSGAKIDEALEPVTEAMLLAVDENVGLPRACVEGIRRVAKGEAQGVEAMAQVKSAREVLYALKGAKGE